MWDMQEHEGKLPVGFYTEENRIEAPRVTMERNAMGVSGQGKEL